MLKRFNEAFGEGIKAEFKSNWPMKETQSRLSNLTKWSPSSPDFVGVFSDNNFKLAIVYTFKKSNNTAFYGVLKEKNNAIVLEGAFSTPPLVRSIGILIFAFLMLMTLGGIVVFIKSLFSATVHVEEMLSMLIGVIIYFAFCGGFGALLLWNFSPTRKDIDVISKAISDTLAVSEHK